VNWGCRGFGIGADRVFCGLMDMDIFLKNLTKENVGITAKLWDNFSATIQSYLTAALC
jgi:hypothetical protein